MFAGGGGAGAGKAGGVTRKVGAIAEEQIKSTFNPNFMSARLFPI